MDYEEVYKRAYKIEGVADAKKKEALLVKNLRTFLEAAKEVMDRRELPYDAFGDYSKESESQGERMTQIIHELSSWDEEYVAPEDCISRQDAIEAVEKQYFGGTVADINPSWRKLHNILESLPPVTPKEQQTNTEEAEECPRFSLLITD